MDYLLEGRPLGTVGALTLLHPTQEIPFVVTNGDVLTDINYGELLDFHIRHEAATTMAVRLHEWQHPCGFVPTRGIDIVGFEEKPVFSTYIIAGVYVINQTEHDFLPDGRDAIPNLFEVLNEP